MKGAAKTPQGERMLNIMLSGCCGSMGKTVTAFAEGRDDIRIVAGIDREACKNGYPAFVSPFSFNGKADVIIDFSSPAAVPGLLEYAVESRTPAVIATTGLGEAHIALIYEAAKNIPIFFSANMSLGINLLCELAKTAARVLGNTYDIEIVETHHAQKTDAPSGTALMLADVISSELEHKPRYEYDRHLRREKRPHDEIGIHSVRGGTAVGEHEIIFAGCNETITLRHCAQSRELFAAGAVNVAKFIQNKMPGLYGMSDMLKGKDAKK